MRPITDEAVLARARQAIAGQTLRWLGIERGVYVLTVGSSEMELELQDAVLFRQLERLIARVSEENGGVDGWEALAPARARLEDGRYEIESPEESPVAYELTEWDCTLLRRYRDLLSRVYSLITEYRFPCPECRVEIVIDVSDDEAKCGACGRRWDYDPASPRQWVDHVPTESDFKVELEQLRADLATSIIARSRLAEELTSAERRIEELEVEVDSGERNERAAAKEIARLDQQVSELMEHLSRVAP
jgi:hypothetical protein